MHTNFRVLVVLSGEVVGCSSLTLSNTNGATLAAPFLAFPDLW